MATIMIREGEIAGRPWRLYMVISDEKVVIVDMMPALIAGWNFGKITVQQDEDWKNNTEAMIVQWKHDNDNIAKVVDLPIDSGFRKRLMAYIEENAK